MKKTKQRTCIGCNRTGQKNEFVRVVVRDEKLTIDSDQQMDGRGIYLCPTVACLEKAKKRRAVNYRLGTRFSGDDLEIFNNKFKEYISQ